MMPLAMSMKKKVMTIRISDLSFACSKRLIDELVGHPIEGEASSEPI